mgnify:CR=1 FL=1
METLKSEVYTDNAEFTAYFDVDTKGIDPEDPDKPDNVPDKYQAKVTIRLSMAQLRWAAAWH